MAEAAEVRVALAEADLVSGLLWAAGVTAVVEEAGTDGTVVLRTDVPAGGPGALAAALGGRWAVVPVVVDDGVDAWRAHARVVRVGRVVVRPPWVPLGPVTPGEVVVEIDPGASFGHGAHPTTRLCLAALDRLLTGPSGSESPANRRADTCPGGESPANRRPTAVGAGTMLDVGCGSGVLAIAGVALGARSAVAVDIDAAALTATSANAARNGVADRVEVRPATETPETGFDVVVANIGAAALRQLAPTLVARVAPGGALVLSGLLDPPPADLADLVDRDAPLTLVADEREDGWTTLTLRRPG